MGHAAMQVMEITQPMIEGEARESTEEEGGWVDEVDREVQHFALSSLARGHHIFIEVLYGKHDKGPSSCVPASSVVKGQKKKRKGQWILGRSHC